MQERSKFSGGIGQPIILAIVVILAIAVFSITWWSIRESRTDSLELLVMQGTAFTESLARAAENAIFSESFSDYLVHLKFHEIVTSLESAGAEFNEETLEQAALDHDAYSIHLFSRDTALIASAAARGTRVSPPEFVIDEIVQLISNPETNYVLLLDPGEFSHEATHYYIELTNDLERVYLISAEAAYYVEALREIQIGYLAQDLSREQGVEYIIYQSTDGIIFSSRKPGDILSIESDPFLAGALQEDSISNRIIEFQGKNVLELVRPFASADYPFGLFRVALSLDGYYSVSRGFNRQMITVSGTLFVMVLVVLLYFSGREKRKKIAREYVQIKSVTDKILEEMHTGVAVVDQSGRITLCNRAFEEILGRSECVGKEWSEMIPKGDTVLAGIVDRGHEGRETETTNRFAGEQKTLLVSAARHEGEQEELDGEKNPGGVVIVVYDITRLKEYERKSARRERLSELGHLAAGVAHEIRNPLNTISIASQRLASEFKPQSDVDEYLSFTTQIKNETKRLNEIITRFLLLAKEQQTRLVDIDLEQFIADFVELFGPEASRLGIELSSSIEPGIRIKADSDLLKQVMANLFNNSKEALGNKNGRIEIKAQLDGDSVIINFSDSGPGIPEEIREEIFAPYFTTKEAGTGLGLPTVYRIVSELGGDVSVESSRLGGAAFLIRLPGRRAGG